MHASTLTSLALLAASLPATFSLPVYSRNAFEGRDDLGVFSRQPDPALVDRT